MIVTVAAERRLILMFMRKKLRNKFKKANIKERQSIDRPY